MLVKQPDSTGVALQAVRISKKQIVRATRSDLEEETTGQVDVDDFVKDLQARVSLCELLV